MILRWFYRLMAASVAISVLGLSVPRFVADFGNLVGNEAAQLAVSGEPLNTFSYERAVRSRERALAWRDSRVNWVELGLLHYNQLYLAERGDLDQFGRNSIFAASAATAFEHSLQLTLVQPTAWLFLADLALQDDERAKAVDALEWSFRTGYFHRPLVERRTQVAFALWDELTPLTRERLQPTIVEMVRRRPALLAELSVDAGTADDMLDMLGLQQPDGPLLAARFYRAVGNYIGFASPLTTQLGDRAAMQRLLASAGLMLTIALPVPAFAMTVEEYLAVNRGETTTLSQGDVLHYLTGVLDATLMTGEVARMQGNPVFCISETEMMALEPGEVKVSLDLMLDEFEREMPNFRELARSRTVGIATLQLFAFLYPCEEPSLAN